MKRQFVRIQPSQSNENRAQQTSQTGTGDPSSARPSGASFTRQQAGVTPPVSQAPDATGQGLLTKWKSGVSYEGFAGNGQPPVFPGSAAPFQPNGSGEYPPRYGSNGNGPLPGSGNTAYRPAPVTNGNGNRMFGMMDGPTLDLQNGQPYTRNGQASAYQQPQHNPFAAYLNDVQAPSRPLSQPLYPSQALPPLYPEPMPGVRNGFNGNNSPSGPNSRPPQPQKKTQRKKKRRVPIWARVIIGILLFFVVLLGGGGAYYYFALSGAVNSIVGQNVQRAKGDDNANASRDASNNPLTGPRLNILLLGSDTDQKFTNPDGSHTYLAQTDIIVTIDPTTKDVSMLSIPRDTWLNVPGYGMRKLDEAYGLGGVALSRLTIHQDFGINIDYYAWVGLDGFVKVIDTAGGVDVDVIHPIVDDSYPDDVGNTSGDIYAYKRLYIAPGPQHLSGPEALEYVRSRHADLVGDFGRSARQQQVLKQLKTRLSNPGIIGKIQELANDLKGFVLTDMNLTQVLQVMNFARTLDQSKIKQVTLGAPYSHIVNNYQRPDGSHADIVVLDCTQVQPLIAQMFNLGDQALCNTGMSSTTAPLASIPAPDTSAQALLPGAASASALPTTMTSIPAFNGVADLSAGVHDLLDLLFMTVFESPMVLQV